MYAADVDGQRLNFAVSGMLWKRSLVMRDDETESLWSHILGKCMRGKLKGKQLEIIPSLLTDWGSWKKRHPDTTAVVMSKTVQAFRREFYKEPRKFVVGISLGKTARAWQYDHLVERRVVNDQWRGKPVVVGLHLPSYSSTIFSRSVNDQTLNFVWKDNKVVDKSTGSTWDLQTGVCKNGELKGKRLRQLRSIPSFAKAWMTFHPESSYWDPENSRASEK